MVSTGPCTSPKASRKATASNSGTIWPLPKGPIVPPFLALGPVREKIRDAGLSLCPSLRPQREVVRAQAAEERGRSATSGQAKRRSGADAHELCSAATSANVSRPSVAIWAFSSSHLARSSTSTCCTVAIIRASLRPLFRSSKKLSLASAARGVAICAERASPGARGVNSCEGAKHSAAVARRSAVIGLERRKGRRSIIGIAGVRGSTVGENETNSSPPP